MSDLGQVALATSRGDNDGFGILNPRLALCGLRTMTGTSNPFRASSSLTFSFSTWGDGQVAWESSKSLNCGWSNNSLPSSPTAAWRWARARRPCFLAGIFFYVCGSLPTALFYVGASFYALTAPHLSTQFLRLPGMLGPQLRDVLKLLFGSVQMCSWPCVGAWMPFDPCPTFLVKS